MPEYQDRTALSYWFPRIEAAGLPVPRTILVEASEAAYLDLSAGINGEDGDGAAKSLVDDIGRAAEAIGFPCFLRTDHTSNKHRWDETCFLRRVEDIPRHVAALAEFSEMADIISLPYRTWVVREYLPITPFGRCPDYRNMPICREFRFFVDGGTIVCAHPYWPKRALEEGGAPADLDYPALCEMADERALRGLAAAAGRAVGGAWSVDILETQRGYYVTDMAEAEKSFHWDGCPHACEEARA